jgi:hypothetical protein
VCDFKVSEEQEQKEKIARVRDLFAMLKIHFADVVVIARYGGGFISEYTDRTWAVGACDRLKKSILDDDLLNEIDKRKGPEDVE